METTNGGQCQQGFYCPEGTHKPIDCDPGTYCETTGLDRPTGNCSAGYYCTLKASIQNPTDGTTGNICPVGHYCLLGSSIPIVCPTGTYLNATGQVRPEKIKDYLLNILLSG